MTKKELEKEVKVLRSVVSEMNRAHMDLFRNFAKFLKEKHPKYFKEFGYSVMDNPALESAKTEADDKNKYYFTTCNFGGYPMGFTPITIALSPSGSKELFFSESVNEHNQQYISNIRVVRFTVKEHESFPVEAGPEKFGS